MNQTELRLHIVRFGLLCILPLMRLDCVARSNRRTLAEMKPKEKNNYFIIERNIFTLSPQLNAPHQSLSSCNSALSARGKPYSRIQTLFHAFSLSPVNCILLTKYHHLTNYNTSCL